LNKTGEKNSKATKAPDGYFVRSFLPALHAGDGAGSVSLSSDGNRLAIGAGGNDGNGDASGHVRVYDLSMFNVFRINPGLNDAWYYKPTSGQG
jgi:hypothetical protein